MERPTRANLMFEKRKPCSMLATMSAAGLLVLVIPEFQSDYISSVSPVKAQGIEASKIFGDVEPDPDDQLLLESDELIYDNDRGLVIALGNVQIAYGRFTLVADKVEYNQQSGRVIAIGNVEILEPNGNRVFAKEIDVTDDFRDGFVSALNVQTPNNARIAAESAERRDGEVTVFNNGVYTACEPCKENPEKPPFWQIRAKKVVVNNNTRTVEYEDASFELFGKPIARLARFAHADPAIKRKSGFMVPEFTESEELGFGVRQAYFFNLAPNYDLTASGTYYSRQGIMGDVEWRHRLANGEYSIRYAGINQDSPGAFGVATIPNSLVTVPTVDSLENSRHAVMTRGLFQINDRWQFGWDALLQTDENFARTYDLSGYDERDITNEIFLTGIGEKNFFDLRGQDFLVQDNLSDFDSVTAGFQTYSDQQASILPILDYNTVSGEEYGMGQVSLDLNITNVSRGTSQISNFDGIAGMPAANERFHGIQGTTMRATGILEWKGSQITEMGAVVTAALNVQSDNIWQQTDNLGTAFNPLVSNDSIYRIMPAGSLEIRYPMIANDGMNNHIFEPIAQIIVRPDETDIGMFANEDAQSLVFDTTNLFEQDKFSGNDRVEGGTRANVGLRYSTSFYGGGTLNIVAGQSYHIAGLNSFAQTNDLTNVGQESGLETDVSDYVASLEINDGQGIATGVAVRLDEANLGLRRAEVSGSVTMPEYTFRGSYVYTDAQPNYRGAAPAGVVLPAPSTLQQRHELRGAGSVKLDENWRLFGSVAYDIETSDVISDSVGIAYDDDCFSFSIGYANLDDEFNGEAKERSISFSIGLRTIGGYSRSYDFDDVEN